MDGLCVDGSMTLRWVDLAASSTSTGSSSTAAFWSCKDRKAWRESRKLVEDHGLTIPMLCCSPDFTHPDPEFRQQQIDLEKGWIDMTVEHWAASTAACSPASGGPRCRAKTGMRYAAESIEACLPHAAAGGVTLILENHYKDNYWQYPEFAQKMDVFCDLVDAHPFAALRRQLRPQQHVPGRRGSARTARACQAPRGHDARQRPLPGRGHDRGPAPKEEDSVGYAKRLRHGEIGQGMNDYDAIFTDAGRRRLRRLDQHRGRRRRHRPAGAQRGVPAAEDAPVLARGVALPHPYFNDC